MASGSLTLHFIRYLQRYGAAVLACEMGQSEILLRLLEPPKLEVHQAPVVERPRVARVEGERRVEARECLLQLPRVQLVEPAVVIGCGKLHIEVDGACIVGGRRLEMARMASTASAQ